MLDWDQMPEAAGPMSETTVSGFGAVLDRQALAQGSVRLPQLDQAELAHGRYVARSGAIPYLPSAEQRDRERDADAEKFERRQTVERAAIAAGQSALEAAASAARVLHEAATAADREVSS